jgi:drug/metabolite transporter (DMT)-like permease
MHQLGSRDTKFLAVSCALAVAVCLPSIDAMAKYLSATYSVIMIVWVRLTLGSLWVGLHVWRESGVAALVPVAWRMQMLRGVVSLLGMVALYRGFRELPMAECTSIVFVAPALANLISRWWLKEPGTPISWALAALSLVGVVIVMRPGGALFTWAAIYPLAGAMALALYTTLTRAVSAHDDPRITAFAGPFTGCLLLSAVMPLFWTMPASAFHVGLFLAIGVIAAATQVLQAMAYRYGSTHIVAPFVYVSIPVTVLLGWAVFGVLPDFWSFVGIGVIALAGLLTLVRS